MPLSLLGRRVHGHFDCCVSVDDHFRIRRTGHRGRRLFASPAPLQRVDFFHALAESLIAAVFVGMGSFRADPHNSLCMESLRHISPSFPHSANGVLHQTLHLHSQTHHRAHGNGTIVEKRLPCRSSVSTGTQVETSWRPAAAIARCASGTRNATMYRKACCFP